MFEKCRVSYLAISSHLLHSSLRNVKKSLKVDSREGFEVFHRKLSERLGKEDACIVLEAVDRTALADLGLHDFGCHCAFSDVSIHENEFLGSTKHARTGDIAEFA